MTPVLVLARVWGLQLAVPLAAVEGGLAYRWWDGGATVPTLDRVIPIVVVLPAALVLSTTWVLAERWGGPMSAAARSVVGIRLARLGAVQVTCAVASAAASARSGSLDAVAATVVGVSLAAVVAPWLGAWLWLPLALAGYGWLQLCAHNVTGDYVPYALPIAVGCAAAGAVAYACWPRPY